MRSTNGGDSWKDISNGIDAKYKLMDLTFSSNFINNVTVFLCTNGDGIYKSTNSGLTWRKINKGLLSLKIKKIYSIPFSEREILFSIDSAGKLYRSIDSGTNWESQYSINIGATAIAYSITNYEERCFLGDSSGNIYSSMDYGKTWSSFYTLKNSGAINCIASLSSKTSELKLIIGTDKSGLYLSDNNGTSFKNIAINVSKKSVRSLVTSPGDQSVVYASLWEEALYKSTDSGKTWSKFSKGLSTDPQANSITHYSPHFSDISFSQSADGTDYILLAGFDGLFRSENGGSSWYQLETLSVSRIIDLSVSPLCDDSFAIGITTYGGGAYLLKYPNLDWKICNTGLKTSRLTGFCFSPNFCKDKQFFSAGQGHLLQYKAHENRWAPVSAEPSGYIGFRRKLFRFLSHYRVPKNFLYHFFSKYDANIPYPVLLVASPEFSNDKTIYFTTRRNGIMYHSFDQHKTFSINDKIAMPSSFAVSPNFKNDHTLFAAERGLGVYKSTNAGSTWEPISDGIHIIEKWRRAFENDIDYTKIIASNYFNLAIRVSPGYAEDQTIFLLSGDGCYKSSDGGKTWYKPPMNNLFGENLIFDLAFSPRYQVDNTVLLSIRGKGLFKSTNSGESFSQTGIGLIQNNHEIHFLNFAPLQNGKTIVGASEENLFISEDIGDTWRAVKRPARYENNRDIISYNGIWDQDENDLYSTRFASIGKSTSSKVSLRFLGTGIKWIGKHAPDLGAADVYIDGEYKARVNQIGDEVAYNKESFAVDNLPFGPHTIEIAVCKDPKFPKSAIGTVIDAFDVINN